MTSIGKFRVVLSNFLFGSASHTSSFSAPPPSANLSAYQAFEAEQGGFVPALQNLYLAGWPVAKGIAFDWPAWKDGTPTQTKTDPSFYVSVCTFASILKYLTDI